MFMLFMFMFLNEYTVISDKITLDILYSLEILKHIYLSAFIVCNPQSFVFVQTHSANAPNFQMFYICYKITIHIQ